MSTIKPTMFNSGSREDLPNVEPDKRVGQPEYTRPVTDSKSTLADTGIISEEIDASSMSSTDVVLAEQPTPPEGLPLTDANTPAPTQDEGVMSKIFGSANTALKAIKPSDVKNTVSLEDGFSFDDEEALKRAGSRLGISNDLSNLDEQETHELLESGSEFLDVLGFSDQSDKLGMASFLTETGFDYANADASQAEGIFGVLNTVTGNEELGSFFNIAEEVALIHALTEKAIEWGIPGYIDDLTGATWDTHAMQVSIERNLSKAARMSDFGMFRDLYDKLHEDRRYALREQYLPELLRYYKIKDGKSHAAQGADLMDITTMVYSNWWLDPYVDGENYVYYFSFCSSDAVTVLSTTQHKIMAYTGEKIKAKSSMAIVSRTLPNYSDLS